MDENIALLERLRSGEKQCESILVEKNMGLVRSAAHKFYGNAQSGIDFEDLCQIGSIGLIKAIRNFDLSRGLMFSTYAVPMIIGEIRKFLRDDGSVSVSRDIREKYFLIRKVTARLTSELCREPLISEVSEASGLDIEDIVAAIDAGSVPMSLDDGSDDDNPLSERLEGGQSPDIDKIALKEAISRLDANDRKLIVLRYFLCKTQNEVSSVLGLTQVQISRREKKIFEQLRLNLE